MSCQAVESLVLSKHSKFLPPLVALVWRRDVQQSSLLCSKLYRGKKGSLLKPLCPLVIKCPQQIKSSQRGAGM